MDEPLRVLFIEDSALDTELEARALRNGGLNIQTKRVETREDLVRTLKTLNPELVISDYSLPSMDGLTALKTVWEVLPEVPFIFVSGTFGEERAIESLKNGATDYVVKDRLGGLVVKVQRALREVEDRTKHRLLEEFRPTNGPITLSSTPSGGRGLDRGGSPRGRVSRRLPRRRRSEAPSSRPPSLEVTTKSRAWPSRATAS